jgi:hypothetical protein
MRVGVNHRDVEIAARCDVEIERSVAARHVVGKGARAPWLCLDGRVPLDDACRSLDCEPSVVRRRCPDLRRSSTVTPDDAGVFGGAPDMAMDRTGRTIGRSGERTPSLLSRLSHREMELCRPRPRGSRGTGHRNSHGLARPQILLGQRGDSDGALGRCHCDGMRAVIEEHGAAGHNRLLGNGADAGHKDSPELASELCAH